MKQNGCGWFEIDWLILRHDKQGKSRIQFGCKAKLVRRETKQARGVINDAFNVLASVRRWEKYKSIPSEKQAT